MLEIGERRWTRWLIPELRRWVCCKFKFNLLYLESFEPSCPEKPWREGDKELGRRNQKREERRWEEREGRGAVGREEERTGNNCKTIFWWRVLFSLMCGSHNSIEFLVIKTPLDCTVFNPLLTGFILYCPGRPQDYPVWACQGHFYPHLTLQHASPVWLQRIH